MSFLYPAALALAGLALVPLLLHLVRRDTDRRVSFPSLRYLQSAQRQSARSMRIRDWLLVAARMAIVVFLALAASRPLIGTGDAGSHRPTDLVLLVDNSASMDRLSGGRTLLESVRQSVAVSLDHASAGDRVWLISAVDGPLTTGGDAEEAARLLPGIRASDAGASLPDAARSVTSTIPMVEDRARELQIFSDLQSGSFQGNAEIADGWTVRILRVAPDDDGNGRVASLAIGPSHPVPPGTSLSVTARLEAAAGTGPAETSSASVPTDARPEARLMVNGQTVAIRTATWGSDVEFAIPAPDPGAYVVRVEIDPEGLRSDDGRQAGIRVAQPSRVRLAGGSGADAEFIAKAIETLDADDRVRLAAGPADLVVQVGGARVDESGGSVGARARVLVPPSDQMKLPAFNRELLRLGIPWSAEPDPAVGALQIREDGLPSVAGESVLRRYRLRPGTAPSSPVDSVLLRTSDGEAWLISGRSPDSVVFLLVGSPLLPRRFPHGTGWAADSGGGRRTLATPHGGSLAPRDAHRLGSGRPFRGRQCARLRVGSRDPRRPASRSRDRTRERRASERTGRLVRRDLRDTTRQERCRRAARGGPRAAGVRDLAVGGAPSPHPVVRRLRVSGRRRVILGSFTALLAETDIAVRIPAPGGSLNVTGCPGAAPSLLASALIGFSETPVVLVLDTPSLAEAALTDLGTGAGIRDARLLPQRETLPFEHADPHVEITSQRVDAFAALLSGRTRLLVTTARGLVERSPVAVRGEEFSMLLSRGERWTRRQLAERLSQMGFEASDSVRELGDFAVRGGIVDLFPFGRDMPIRIELWDDEIASIRSFDLLSQRSVEKHEHAEVLPVSLDPAQFEESGVTWERRSLLELLPEGSFVLEVGRSGSDERRRRLWNDVREAWGTDAPGGRRSAADLVLPPSDAERAFRALRRIRVEPVEGETPPGETRIDLGIAPPPAIDRNMQALAAGIEEAAGAGQRVVLLCDNEGQLERLEEILEDLGRGRLLQKVDLALGSLSGGMRIPGPEPLLVMTDHEVFQRSHRVRRGRTLHGVASLESIASLSP
ncbi:MAG: BatA domain-containing protein, partial [Gemmatimonadota bacterium]